MALLRSVVVLLVGAIGALSATATAQAAGDAKPVCMDCHRPSDTTIDPGRYAQGVHGSLDCATCHTEGFSEFPHRGTRTGAPDCTDCHGGASPYNFDGIAKGVKESVHAKVVDPAFRCTNCHSPHYFVPATRMTDVAAAIGVARQTCLGCHARGDTQGDVRLALGKLVEKHRWFPHAELHFQANPCIACHTRLLEPSTSTALDRQRLLHIVLPASGALKDCVGCHAQNSLLVTKLYTHLALKDRAEMGWVNSILFNTAYVSGATRNRWLDWGTLGLTGLTVVGVAMHGLGRWLCARLRRRS